MILYHGSGRKLDVLEARQAQKADDISVPENELLKAIYLSPEYDLAVAIAAQPHGKAEINDKEKTIEFENPHLFNPEKEIFIYEIDTNDIPKENLVEVEKGKQYAIVGMKVKPISVEELKAEEVLKYYKLTNWKKEDKEPNSEIKLR